MSQDEFENHRPLMFSIAYRMLGSAMEAEDVVQEAYLRYQATPIETIQSHKAFLSTVVTRLCLDQLKSAQAQREVYPGPWLPEPILTTPETVRPDSDEYDSLSMAMLVLLEKLTPAERAVFLLRAVFDYDYAEITEIVGKEEAACRQLYSRAQKHIAANRPRFKSSPEKHAEMLGRFMQAISVGDLSGLTNLLAEDVTWWSDGGGKVSAATRPIHGRENVRKFVFGIYRFAPENLSVEVAEINGQPAIVMRLSDHPFYVISLVIDQDANGNDVIREVHAVGNPDKLKNIGKAH